MSVVGVDPKLPIPKVVREIIVSAEPYGYVSHPLGDDTTSDPIAAIKVAMEDIWKRGMRTRKTFAAIDEQGVVSITDERNDLIAAMSLDAFRALRGYPMTDDNETKTIAEIDLSTVLQKPKRCESTIRAQMKDGFAAARCALRHGHDGAHDYKAER